MTLCALQDSDGRQVDTWGNTPIRVTDLAVSPDLSRLVVVGMHNQPPQPPVNELGHQRDHHHGGETATPPPVPPANATPTNGEAVSEYRMIIYDLGTKQVESYVFPFSVRSLLFC
jgi:WD repeat-containing protein 26